MEEKEEVFEEEDFSTGLYADDLSNDDIDETEDTKTVTAITYSEEYSTVIPNTAQEYLDAIHSLIEEDPSLYKEEYDPKIAEAAREKVLSSQPMSVEETYHLYWMLYDQELKHFFDHLGL